MSKPTEQHTDSPAHVHDCLDCAVAAAKRQLDGVDVAQAGMIAPLLPEHLRQPFWRQAIERYLSTALGAEGSERTAAPATPLKTLEQPIA